MNRHFLDIKIFPLFFLCVVVIISHTSISAAHPNKDLIDIEAALYKWANGLTNNQPDIVTSVLSKDFVGPNGQARSAYLSNIQDNSDISKVILKNAPHEFVEHGVRVSPIEIHIANGFGHLYISVLLVKEESVWKVGSIDLIDSPSVLPVKFLPEHFTTYPVSISMYEKNTGSPVYARVHITDEKGRYWPPRGHQKTINIGWREDVGGDVRVSGKTYAYVGPDFIVDLPVGKYHIEAEKGIEYESASMDFYVNSVDNKSQRLIFNRWINMENSGWYSGDTHTHFLNDHTAVLEAQAEDLNVINVLATKWGELITNIHDVTGSPSLVSTDKHIVFFNEEVRHPFLGHAILHPIRKLIYPLSWGEGMEGVYGGYDFPPMAYQADKARAQGGLVTWAHFMSANGEVAIDVALGKVDTIDLFTWVDVFKPTNKHSDRPDSGIAELWYAFLNTGARLPVTAGTDKMMNTQVAGSSRTYAHIDSGDFSYDSWIDALRNGRTFITTGPIISLKANNEDIGSVVVMKPGETIRLEAEVRTLKDRYPVDKIEIIQNGKVVATQINDDQSELIKLSFESQINKSSWFAVRAYGARILPNNTWPAIGSIYGIDPPNGFPVMAHTSPIYAEIPGSKIWLEEDAAFLAKKCDVAINWAKTRAKFHTEIQRKEVIELFEKAREKYLVLELDKNP